MRHALLIAFAAPFLTPIAWAQTNGDAPLETVEAMPVAPTCKAESTAEAAMAVLYSLPVRFHR